MVSRCQSRQPLCRPHNMCYFLAAMHSPNAFAGVLRSVRNELIPHVPQLAAQLSDNPFAIRGAIRDAVERHDVDPDDIGWRGLNKAERQTMAGFVIGEQRKALVVGQGPEARFRPVGPFRQRQPNQDPEDYPNALNAVLDIGARYVERIYTRGTDPEHSWWPVAAKRYRRLGWLAAATSGFLRFDLSTSHFMPTVPIEGVSLRESLRTLALSTTMEAHFDYIRKRMPEAPREECLAAAHDLAYLVTTRASLHIVEHKGGYFRLTEGSTIQKNAETGRYEVIYPKGTRPRTNRPKRLPNPTLKCPAHAANSPDPTENRRDPTNLSSYVHAAISEATYYTDLP
jgi:hypothetical protein